MMDDVIKVKCGRVHMRGMATVVSGVGVAYDSVISHRSMQWLRDHDRLYDDLAAAQAEAARLTAGDELYRYHVNAAIDAESKRFCGFVIGGPGVGKG